MQRLLKFAESGAKGSGVWISFGAGLY